MLLPMITNVWLGGGVSVRCHGVGRGTQLVGKHSIIQGDTIFVFETSNLGANGDILQC